MRLCRLVGAHYAGRAGWDDVEDAVQTALLHVLEKDASFDLTRPPRPEELPLFWLVKKVASAYPVSSGCWLVSVES